MFFVTLKLAFKRYSHDRLFALCSIFSLVAFLAPLLTLMGIKDGIIGTLTDRLIQNPRNLELTPRGVGKFPDAFFRELKTHPATGFIIPETRTLSATLSLLKPDYPALRVDLLATGPLDPLVMAATPPPDTLNLADNQIFLALPAAKRLDLKPGDTITGQVSRLQTGFEETKRLELTVIGLLPEEVANGYYLFCSLPLLKKLEDYRSGFEVKDLGWAGKVKPVAPILYPRFRLYAKNLDGVEELKAYLAKKGLDMLSRAEEIALVRRLDHAFTVVFLALLAVVGGGAFASVASGAVDQVVKIRRSLAVLSLLGLSRAQLMAFTVFQSIFTGFLAVITAEALFLGLSRILNFYFGDNFGLGERVCFLTPEKLALAGGATLIFMLIASSAAMISLLDLEPSEGMRDV
ncbi:MAG: ABC transporter permease [Deltaproteobacteria bacterium]|nr:ABC transporter permease [Deltaproteobacteria bacterium]